MRVAKIEKSPHLLAASFPPLSLNVNRVAHHAVHGTHGRRKIGVGESFWQFRPYASEDPVRLIDWRQSAKHDKIFVRENEWEAIQSVWLWRDASPDMAYRSTSRLPTKRERADLLTGAIALLLIKGNEQVALLGAHQPARRKIGNMEAHLQTVTASLEAITTLPSHCFVILIGGFLEPLTHFSPVFSFFQEHQIKGHILQILDPAEITLPFKNHVVFQEMGGDDQQEISHVDSIRATYVKKITTHCQELEQHAKKAGWSFSQHQTDQSPKSALNDLYQILC